MVNGNIGIEVMFVIAVSIMGIIFAAIKAFKIKGLDAGNDKMKEISKAIHEGAMAFLNKEYRIIVIFILVVAASLWLFVKPDGKSLSMAFICGGVFSAIAGNIGMRIATMANARTAQAAKHSMNSGLKVAFSSGTVMGLGVVSMGLLGVSLLYIIFGDPNIIYGFGFGASSIALFARVGGGIYTKAADVGADLVGKVEMSIPEDDPRNPAVIADNVGDNVGDVAGMGADLFESYVDSIIAAMVLATVTFAGLKNTVLLPMMLAATGIICSIIGTFFVRVRKDGKDAHGALNRGIFGAAILMAIASWFVINAFMPRGDVSGIGALDIYISAIIGLVSGIAIGLSTEYYTSNDKKPAQAIAKAAQMGAGPAIIDGIATGMISTIIPIIAICVAIFVSFKFGGLYGIAIAAVGMLSTLGITLATDSYGPVADNAAGIAEMAGMGKVVRERAEALDAVGNTTAAIGKGFAIGSAALTALALFVSYSQVAKLSSINIQNTNVMIGLFIGGLLPFIFSALTMRAVGNAAIEMVEEVRRQFKTIKGLMEGTAKPDYTRCVHISTGAALKEMIIPTLLAVLTPIVLGIVLGAEAVGGLLAGSLVTGFLIAVFMANAGGAWDNAKKFIEAGNFGGKGSETHKAAVVGDTVGDPFKDTSGPALNILIKLISIVAIVFAPLFI